MKNKVASILSMMFDCSSQLADYLTQHPGFQKRFDELDPDSDEDATSLAEEIGEFFELREEVKHVTE